MRGIHESVQGAQACGGDLLITVLQLVEDGRYFPSNDWADTAVTRLSQVNVCRATFSKRVEVDSWGDNLDMRDDVGRKMVSITSWKD